MTKKYSAPLELRISLPHERDYIYGEQATSSGIVLHVRVNKSEKEKIRQACAILGVKTSVLVRHCTVKYAEELINHRAEWIRSKINEVQEPDSS